MPTGFMTPHHTAVNVGAISTLALAAHDHPAYRRFENPTADTDMFLKLGAPAVLNEGIFLAKGGANPFEMSQAKGNLYIGAVYAIHAGEGDKVLLVTQGV